MKTFSSRLGIVWLALVFATLGMVRASGPIAVFALLDRVVLEPNDNAPTRIQLWGTFSVAKERYSGEYRAPEKGYLYYKLESNMEQPTRSIWADLKKVAGSGEVVGFGGGYASREDLGRVRPASEKLKDPDFFPIGNPVTRLGNAQADIAAKIKAASQAR
jgi:hypothetical protein